jgi:dsDNA-specific endonuclease/ATPase MutS2
MKILMKFKIGDKVVAVNEDFEGLVKSIDDENIIVESTDGFPISFSEKELIKMEDDFEIKIKYTEGISEAKKEKEPKPNKAKTNLSVRKKSIPAMEVDLHIEKLVPSTRGLDNFDIVNIQMDTAKRQLDFAIQKRFQRIIFIHGVGEGVLKSELESLFRRYEYLNYYDADYQKYGRGATEVYIPQNPK